MLTASAFDLISVPIVDIYEQFQQAVINDIARRLASLDMTATAAWQMQRLIESGKVYETAISELSKITGKSETELHTLFAQAGVKSIGYDDRIYKAAGLNPLPISMSPAMTEVLLAGLDKTNGVMRNLTMTTALTGQEAFISAADTAYMEVTAGAFSYDQAIRMAIKDVAKQGLSVIQYGGRKEQLDVAMRRTVLTGVAQTTGQLQVNRAQEMDVDLVQTSAHAGSRPTHAVWQGRIFSRSGSSSKYPPFVESTGYGKVDGLCGINCRHSFYPFFEGYSDNAYTAKDRKELADKTVKLNGDEVSQYEASQRQRQIEREIRNWKRQSSALEAAGKDNSYESGKVNEWQKSMRDFVSQTQLQRQRVREQI
jgi:hypothetical protein